MVASELPQENHQRVNIFFDYAKKTKNTAWSYFLPMLNRQDLFTVHMVGVRYRVSVSRPGPEWCSFRYPKLSGNLWHACFDPCSNCRTLLTNLLTITQMSEGEMKREIMNSNRRMLVVGLPPTKDSPSRIVVVNSGHSWTSCRSCCFFWGHQTMV